LNSALYRFLLAMIHLPGHYRPSVRCPRNLSKTSEQTLNPWFRAAVA
jgi:hypothetical protein